MICGTHYQLLYADDAKPVAVTGKRNDGGFAVTSYARGKPIEALKGGSLICDAPKNRPW